MGGVCDITHKDSLTKKISYIWRSGEELQARARTLDGTPVSIGYIYIYIDRVGHFTLDLSLIPGKSYKLRTSETYDVIGHDLFMYDIYQNYTFG